VHEATLGCIGAYARQFKWPRLSSPDNQCDNNIFFGGKSGGIKQKPAKRTSDTIGPYQKSCSLDYTFDDKGVGYIRRVGKNEQNVKFDDRHCTVKKLSVYVPGMFSPNWAKEFDQDDNVGNWAFYFRYLSEAGVTLYLTGSHFCDKAII
jgi:hypothetical protein